MRDKDINVLILCTYESTYVLQLYSYVKMYYPQVKYSLFTQDKAKEYYVKKLKLELGEEIYSFGNHEYLCGVEAYKLPYFDIIHSLWMERFWGEFAGIFKSKCKAWFCSVGGSDLYRDSGKIIYRILQNRIVSRADWISSEGEETRVFFNQVFAKRCKGTQHSIIRYGIDVLDEFAYIESIDRCEIKKKYHLPEDKLVVMCGTNARKQHQHFEMIDAIRCLPQSIKDKICLLIPMTYSGEKDYIEKVRNYAESIIETVVLTDYLSSKEMAEVTKITDILIHIQTTDQLSSMMLSHMFCGNVVIAGAWLPYNELRSKGIYFLSIDEIIELKELLVKVISSYDDYKSRCVRNNEIIYDMSSWKKSAEDWYNVYMKLI